MKEAAPLHPGTEMDQEPSPRIGRLFRGVLHPPAAGNEAGVEGGR